MAQNYYPWQANTTGTPAPDLYMEISANNIENMGRVGTAMYNPAVSTTAETIWPEGGRYVWPAAASVLTISSTSADDTAAGTGARAVAIDGLAADYSQIFEIVTLNGTTPVTTTQQFYRVNVLYVVDAGSTGTNAGILYTGTGTVTAGKPANVWNLAVAGDGLSHSGIYTVPKGKAAHLTFLQVGTESAKAGELALHLRFPTGLKYLSTRWQVGNTLTLEPRGFGRATEGTDVEWAGMLTTGTGAWSGFWGAILRNESEP